ncbi:hypothetical protein [Catenuloplanes japonicus]|uniref:hypothetical protein n=1 Tax=Catenuloplanes japonicus TaxID=33876 RepID=UPI00052702C2|nr:hypothetical protein [Catenuloplanes japonicus]
MIIYSVPEPVLTAAALPLPEHPALYLAVAGFCLIAALRSLRQALEPIGVVVETVKATIVVAFSISVALIFLLAAALSG